MPVPAAASHKGRSAHLGVLALTVAVFGAAMWAVSDYLRRELREQIQKREAETLAGLASMQLDNADTGGVPLSEVPTVFFAAVLKTSKYPGVVGVQVFDARRQYCGAFPFRWSEEPLADRV